MSSAEGRARRPLLLGITGPIGCGKSTVAKILAALGGTAIDADILARRATEPGRAALGPIRERFGDVVFDAAGNLDRAAMAKIAFDDPEALADLERIVHPEVRALLDEELRAAMDAPFVAIEAIKLVEGGLALRCDEVWLIDCGPDAQRSRLAARGDNDVDSRRRIEAQGHDLVAKLEAELAANAVAERRPRVRRLVNDGSLDDLGEAVEDALAEALLSEDLT
jgi:dephospho-CoA kinase